MGQRLSMSAVVLLVAVALPAAQTSRSMPAAAGQACASCHAEIAKSYSQTVMARASGPAIDGIFPGEFLHQPSGVRYRVTLEDGRAWLHFDRAGDPKISGKRELSYFLGSNRKGRTYLYSIDGFLFQAPITSYSHEGRWNMAPPYTEARQAPLALPAVMDCLNCHTSGSRPPEAGTENQFGSAPIAHQGITCARCHGADTAHATAKGAIVNPAKLAPQRRDSICMECHLEGSVAIERRGKHVYDFRPGDDLFDFMRYFVFPGREGDGRALSQVEALRLSVCKQKSGDRMSCTSCHDPHAEPLPAQKASYFRSKCLACHAPAFAAKHHPEQPDCVGCHMPSLPSHDVAHTQATDHRILRRPLAPVLKNVMGEPKLVPFAVHTSGDKLVRELALAWETLAESNTEGALPQAEKYLQQALQSEPDDPVLLGAMAYVEQKHGHADLARELYERALKLDPLSNEAATNLGVLEAAQGNVRRAAELWQGAFARAPYRSAIGVNMAIVFCAAGQREPAKKYLDRVLQFNPDYRPALRLAEHMAADPPQCKP